MTNGPFEMRHEEGGYVEFLNEDVPTVVREIDVRVAILTTLEQPRKMVGYRVYDPGSSPSEVFGSASPAGVGVETEYYHELLMRLQAVQHATDRPYAASVAKDASEAIKALLRTVPAARAIHDKIGVKDE